MPAVGVGDGLQHLGVDTGVVVRGEGDAVAVVQGGHGEILPWAVTGTPGGDRSCQRAATYLAHGQRASVTVGPPLEDRRSPDRMISAHRIEHSRYIPLQFAVVQRSCGPPGVAMRKQSVVIE